MKKTFKPLSDAFDGEPVAAVDLKGWLIYYNLVIDSIILDTKKITNLGKNQEEVSSFETAVILIEDKRFYKHNGFDIFCIPRIFRQVATLKKIGGVSTLEQQYVRTLLNKKERTLKRKFHEIIISCLLSHRLKKDTILKSYLAIAYFGYKLNGCEKTSKLIFGKEPNELTEKQAAILASMLVYPLPKKVKEELTCNRTFPLGLITETFFKKAEPISPNWTANIKRRSEFSLRLLKKAKKS